MPLQMGGGMAAGLSLVLLLALSVCPAPATTEPPSQSPGLALLSELKIEVARNGAWGTLAKVLMARPFLGRHVREVLLPAGKGTCFSALDCSIEAAHEFHKKALRQARRAHTYSRRLQETQRSLNRSRRLHRRAIAVSSGHSSASLPQIAIREMELHLKQQTNDFLATADAKLQEIDTMSLNLDFEMAQELEGIEQALLYATHQHTNDKQHTDSLANQLLAERVRAEAAEAQVLNMQVEAKDTEMRAADSRILMDQVQAQNAEDFASRNSQASSKVAQLNVEIEHLRFELKSQVLQTEQHLSETEKSGDAMRTARYSAERLAEQYKQTAAVAQEAAREMKRQTTAQQTALQQQGDAHEQELGALQSQLTEISAKLRESEQKMREQQLEKQQDLRAEKELSQLYQHELALQRSANFLLLTTADEATAAAARYSLAADEAVAALASASSKGWETQSADAMSTLFLAADTPVSCGVSSCMRGQPLCDMLRGASSTSDARTEGMETSSAELPHQAVASLVMLILGTGVSVVSLVCGWNGVPDEKSRVCLRVQEVQTEGPTVEEMETGWRGKVQGADAERAKVEQRMEGVQSALEVQQMCSVSLQHQLEWEQQLLQEEKRKWVLDVEDLHTQLGELQTTKHLALESAEKVRRGLQADMAGAQRKLEAKQQSAKQLQQQLSNVENTHSKALESAEVLRQDLEDEYRKALASAQELQRDLHKVQRKLEAEQQSASDLQQQLCDAETTNSTALASAKAVRKDLEADVAGAKRALEAGQKSASVQLQHVQQDAEKAQRQMAELKETLQKKTKAVCSLQQQVQQQKLILLAAQRQEAAQASTEDAAESAGMAGRKQEDETKARKSMLSNESPTSLVKPLALNLRELLKVSPSPRCAPSPRVSAALSGAEANASSHTLLAGEGAAVRTIVQEIENREWAHTTSLHVLVDTCSSPPRAAQGVMKTRVGEVQHPIGLQLFSPDMAPGMRHVSRASAQEEHSGSPGAMPKEADDFDAAACAVPAVPLPMSQELNGEFEWAAHTSRTASVAGSVADDARSEISACDSEDSFYSVNSATGSVRSLTSNFSEASGISLNAMSQAATQASGGSRAEREAARRERHERRAKRAVKASSSSLLFGDGKENSHNGVNRASVLSSRGLRAKV